MACAPPCSPTRKGAFFLSTLRDRGAFALQGPDLLGHIVHHAVADPRDRRYRGIRFRMISEHDALRPHMRILVNREPVASLDVTVDAGDEIIIMQALSRG